MMKKIVGLGTILLACLLGLVSLLGVLGLFVSEKTDGKLSSALVFLIIVAMAVFLLKLGMRLARAKATASEPRPAVAHGAESIAAPIPAPDTAPHPSMAAPLSPLATFPSRKPAEPYRPVYSEDSQRVIDDLLALNRDDIPFRIVDGRDEGVDLIAEWKIVEAEFYALFAAAGVRRVFRIYMKLDPGARTVRTKDQEYGVRWNKGIPAILEGDYFQGQKFSMQWHVEIALRKKDRMPGVVVNYTFSTSEIKKPLKQAIKACGWKYKGIAFGKL